MSLRVTSFLASPDAPRALRQERHGGRQVIRSTDVSSAAAPSVETDAPRILIAEDHMDSREALRALLEAIGYEVYVAHDGRQAVEHALAVQPDLILMDIMMPGVDGLAATRTLRAHPGFRQVPIIALTAMEGARERVREAGCDDMVAKPIDVSVFFRKVGEWIAGSRSA